MWLTFLRIAFTIIEICSQVDIKINSQKIQYQSWAYQFFTIEIEHISLVGYRPTIISNIVIRYQLIIIFNIIVDINRPI